MDEPASADAPYGVYREEDGRRFPNGRFSTREDAEAKKKEVKDFHGAGTRVVIEGPEDEEKAKKPQAVGAK